MKKKLLGGSIMALGLTVLVLIVIKISREKEDMRSYPEIYSDIALEDIFGNDVILDMSDYESLILVFYSSGCLFCEHQAKDIMRNREEFKNTRVAFITSSPLDSAVNFSVRNGIHDDLRFSSLLDPDYEIILAYGVKTTPTTLIYNKNRELVGSFAGETIAKQLLKHIE